MKKTVKLYDTTLRDGSQGEGISFTVQDKLFIAEKLDQLGIHYVEGGWPGSNPKDMEFFKQYKKLHLKNAKVAAFGATRRANLKAGQDPNLKAILEADTEVVTIFGKSWDLHVTDVFRINLDENLKMICDSVNLLKSKGREVIYDAEHFFDGYKANPEYAIRSLRAAEEGGADLLALCDTNGGTLTLELARIVAEVGQHVSVPLGIHVHNDGAVAVANSVSAVEAGCVQVQGTINGYGERCGNADLVPIIANLQLKLGYKCVTAAQLESLTSVSHYVAEIANMRQAGNQPYVGASAFAHKAGVHVNAVRKNSVTYEHVDPSKIGNARRFLMSELSGVSNVLWKAEQLGFKLDKGSPEVKKILSTIQDLEFDGYHFEEAEASLEIMMRRLTKSFEEFFAREGFRVVVAERAGKVYSEAIIKVNVDGESEHTVAEGDGPVNALDNAVRKALEKFYPSLSEMHLSDFKVRVLDEKAGTAAKVRVSLVSQDKEDSWTTAGVSENIIEASWIALIDSIEYKLLKDSRRSKAAPRRKKVIRRKK
ncbi:MAG: citramalate synthase [Candidatus Omnitrophica bacterium]|nr:citramalate synthase [Candidatus Omnitrophota bacterium]